MEEVTVRTMQGYTEEDIKKKKRKTLTGCDGMCQMCQERCIVREEALEIS